MKMGVDLGEGLEPVWGIFESGRGRTRAHRNEFDKFGVGFTGVGGGAARAQTGLGDWRKGESPGEGAFESWRTQMPWMNTAWETWDES